MFAKLKSWWLWLWGKHIQKTTAWIIGTLVSLDLGGLAEPLKGLVGPKRYYGAVVGLAVINAARAHMAKAPEVLPTPTVKPMT